MFYWSSKNLGGTRKMESKKKIDHFCNIYKTLKFFMEDSYEAREAMVSLRFLLIDAVGNDKKRELIKQWNKK